MSLEVKPVLIPSQIPETITYLEREARGEEVGTGRKVRQIEEVYFQISEEVHQQLLKMVHIWGDQPAIRQILFYHYLIKEPILKEVMVKCIYPGFINGRYEWDEKELRHFLKDLGLTNSEQVVTLYKLEKALQEVRMFSENQKSKYIEYQRPALEAMAYALYAEYGEGFEPGRRFHLHNPPLEQILQHAEFPAYFLLNPRVVPMMLEACRMKDYISLEARGGLCQYALICNDLTGLVEYMVEGGNSEW